MARIEKLCAPGVCDPRGPASTFVPVASLSHPDYLIELEAIAVL